MYTISQLEVRVRQGIWQKTPDPCILGSEIQMDTEKNGGNGDYRHSGESKPGQNRTRNAGRRAELARKRRKRQLKMRLAIGGGILLLVLAGVIIYRIAGKKEAPAYLEEEGITVPRPELDVQLLTINPNSRPGLATDRITGIVVHYTANPGSTAQQNRDYFESLKDSQETSVSSNFIIGLDGEIIQCVPTAEVAYASNSRNFDTVSIECCHPDNSGRFTDDTYHSLVELVAWLCQKFGLDTDDIIRHYDITGKDCPKYFVENEEAWIQFKEDVSDYIKEYS